jgi:hypothetical protein
MPPGRPLNKPRGLELYELVANVAANVDLLTLYAFATLSADDMRLVPFVLGAQQMSGGSGSEGTVRAERQLLWRTDASGRTVYLDGQEWPCRSDSQVLIPAGEHTVSTRPQAESAGQNELRIESVNGAIVAAERSGERVTLSYQSRGRCYVVLNRQPKEMLCDGAPGVSQVQGDGEHVCLVLPQGRHHLEMK